MRGGARVGRTVIGKLRLRGADLEPLSARLRLESLLGGAHLMPVGLPPSATVCIRRLMDPKPGVLPVRQHALRPPAAWDEAVVSALEAQVARAARPALGAVPPDAEAVLFADPAELMACLASDVSRGSALAHWWWRGLFPNADLARTVVSEWMRQPEYVPAALETTARRREARPVLALFTEDEARTVLAQVARVHGLTALARVRAVVEDGSSREVEVPRAGEAVRSEPAQESGGEAPWSPWVPEVRTLGLGRAREALMGVGLMLRRAPEETRRPSFAPAVVAWRDGGSAGAVVAEVRVRPVPESPTLEVQPYGEGPRIAEVSRTAIAERVSEAAGTAEMNTPSGVSGVAPAAVGAASERGPAETGAPIDFTAAPVPTSPGAVVTDSEAHRDGMVTPASAGEAMATVPPAPPSEALSPPRVFEPPPGRAWGLPIPTGLGGLFYLVNLALFLELYGDFSRPAHPHLPLSLWDFVTLLGRKLLVDPRTGDPVWKVLALLAGRKAGDAPGQGFEPPEAWRASEEWLRAFRTPETSVWTWEVKGDRLRVLHPAGFLVVDVARASDDAESQLQREVELYRASPALSFALVPGDVPPPAADDATSLERWLAWLVPYCRARLNRALGLTPDDALALEATLLTHDARLHVTETHVDVVLALSQLPLAVRIAGLDRDIGWLPSVGRHLTFHFE